MDWGLAKVLSPRATVDPAAKGRDADSTILTVRNGSAGHLSRAGSVMGTPAYMAPEQARGEIEWLDERVDVFGLGAILCEILTGAPPYVGQTVGDIQELAAGADLCGARRRLDACGADSELVALTPRCLGPLPRDRPRHAGEVAADFSGYLHGVQARLKQAELTSAQALAKVADEKTRRRLAVGLAAAIVVLMATLAGGGSWLAWERQRRAAAVELAVRDVEVLKTEAEVAVDDLTKWHSAHEAARRLEQLRDDSRDAATRAQVGAIVSAVQEKAASAEADNKLLAQLAETRDAEDDIASAQADAMYEAAFRTAGVDLFSRT
jgi:serine/threonine-protein kinase